MENGHTVLDFTYSYLKARSRPPNDEEVRKVTATIAQFKGPQVVPWATLEKFLAKLIEEKRP